jgi:hypothetical protein
MSNTHTPTYTIHPQVATALIDGCQVLLLAAGGEVLVLNPTATLAWQAIAAAEDAHAAPPTAAALAAHLAAHFTVTPAAAAADLAPLLAALAAAGALVPQ